MIELKFTTCVIHFLLKICTICLGVGDGHWEGVSKPITIRKGLKKSALQNNKWWWGDPKAYLSLHTIMKQLLPAFNLFI